MTIIGTVSKKMVRNNELSFMSSNGQTYDLPLKKLDGMDLHSYVYLTEDGKVVMEKFKHKRARFQANSLYSLWVREDEDRPIINLDTEE